MNRNLERAIDDLKKVEALMLAYETTYLDVEPGEDNFELNENRQYAFYALWDAIRKVGDDLDRLAADTRIVDVVQAIARNGQK